MSGDSRTELSDSINRGRSTYSLYENSRNDRIAYRQHRANSMVKAPLQSSTLNNSHYRKLYRVGYGMNDLYSSGCVEQTEANTFKNRTHSVGLSQIQKNRDSQDISPFMNTLNGHSGKKYFEKSKYWRPKHYHSPTTTE